MGESVERRTASAVSSLAGSSVLVVGGAGYLGRRVARTLSGPCDVTVLDDLLIGDRDAVPDSVEFVRTDVRAVDAVSEAMADADVAFHLSAHIDARRSLRSPVETHNRIASGTVTVLDAARRTDTRILVGSDAAVYGDASTLPVHEDDPKRPVSPYGVAMLGVDHFARLYADRYDLPTVVLRYFTVYGPGKPTPTVVNEFVRRARTDRPLVVHGDGTQTRDFTHVDDALQATIQAAASDATGRAFNVGTGERYSVSALAETVRESTDTESDVVHVDPRPGDIRHSQADISRARQVLGYEPTVDIHEGIRSLIAADAGSSVTA